MAFGVHVYLLGKVPSPKILLKAFAPNVCGSAHRYVNPTVGYSRPTSRFAYSTEEGSSSYRSSPPMAFGVHVYLLGKVPSPKILLKAFEEVKPNLILMVPLKRNYRHGPEAGNITHVHPGTIDPVSGHTSRFRLEISGWLHPRGYQIR